MSEPTESNPKGRGGTHFHNPDCACNPCKARRRTEEALAESTRAGGTALATQSDGPAEVLEADIIIAPPKWKHGQGGPGSKKLGSRAIIADWLHLRALEPDITLKEASVKLGMHRTTLSAVINNGVKEGWLRFDDPLSRIEHQIVPKVLDNLNHFLDARDKTVTIETAKGTVFKTYQESKGISQTSNTVLALKIEMPEGMGETKIVTGSVVGKPKVIIDVTEENAF